MAAIQSASDDSPGERIKVVLSEYRVVGYGIAAILAVWMLGYVVDLASGPYTESTELAHTIAGMLGAAALVLAICGAFIAVLWGGLFLSRRRGD